MRRFLASVAALLALVAPVSAVAANPPPPPPPPTESGPAATPPADSPSPPAGEASWAQKQISTVVAAGLMAPSAAAFRPDDPLTKGELAELLAALGGVPSVPPNPAKPVKLRELDAALVKLLGLAPEAKQLRNVLTTDGLAPRVYTGNEVVARLLGLRTNHPQADESLELGPADAVTRAETAYSVAAVLAARGTGLAEAVGSQVAAFALPQLSGWQQRVLARAVSFVGYPYVWGGSSERSQAPFGQTVPGGFDCSGFVWRVYKLEPFQGAAGLADTLRGRTTYAMSGEVGPELRIPFGALAPADVLFFGSNGPKSKPGQVTHMGIYLGNGWMVHSSSRGTTIAPLAGWYTTSFAWARRPLGEAGLG
jgi:cell wall-associated NlpC family hydrolase